MAEYIRVSEVADYLDKDVVLKGWLFNKSGKGKLSFLQFRDGSGIIQAVVFKTNVDEATWEAAQALTQESSLIVTGTVAADTRSKLGFEIQVTSLEIVNLSDGYPITPKEHGSNFLLDNRHLWLRSKKQHAILTIRSTVALAIRDFFDGEGFVNVDAPIFTPNACEGTSTLFQTDYFGDTAFLTQSGQLYMEAAAAAFGKVYCFGPTFRAEKSKTRRHLTEFWMIEPEVAFMELDEDMNLAERFTMFILERVLERHRDLLVDVLERDLTVLETSLKGDFPRVHYN
ncbi:asparagine--tRNA ligase, partial [bacterium]|nr:asparagine--tRNA ligase [bacterium]